MDMMSLEKLMSREIATLTPAAPITDALRLMAERRVSCVLVVDAGNPAGIVTERDMVRLAAAGNGGPGKATVGEVMSAPLVTLHPGDGLFAALVIVRTQRIRHLPIVDEQGGLVGLVTETDLVKGHFELYERQQEIIRQSIAVETRDLRESNRQLREMSMQDPLLGIGNRRAMEIDLRYTHHLAVRGNRPYSVVLFDIDHFKLFNDHYGHPAGDQVLRTVAQALSESMRGSDRLYRYGGEEMLALLPETPTEGARVLAERMLEQVRALGIPHEPGGHGILTLSGGIGAARIGTGTDGSWEEVVAEADRALYRAKQRGRNRIGLSG
jgi:diguanylate cyclase (GGDEF)-like protein